MDKYKLIETLKRTFSAVDFYNLKDEIIAHLEGKAEKKKSKEAEL